MFKNRSNYGEKREFSQSGMDVKIQEEYGLVKDKESFIPGVKGKKNVYELRQQARNTTELNVLIQRYMRGDVSAIPQAPVGDFIDTVGMPKDFMEVQNAMVYGQQYFESLPVQVREKYGHNISTFLKAVDEEKKNIQKNLNKVNEKEVIKDGEENV